MLFRSLVPGPLPCPEVVAVFYIRPAEVPTLFSVEGDTQVEQQNTVVGFLTQSLYLDRSTLAIGTLTWADMALSRMYK